MLTSCFYVYNPSSCYTKYQHPTEQSARLEAERLARLYPGQVFQVLELKGQCVKNDVIWEVPLDELPF